MITRYLHSMRAPARRCLTTIAQTIYSPTPEFLTQHLLTHRPPEASTSLYLLTTSTPTSQLSPLLKQLHTHLPDSIGSFSLSPPHTESSLSILTFSDAKLKTFRSDLTGRPAVEVGRWQRPREESMGDAKGRSEGGIEDIWSREGWAGVWKEDENVGRVEALAGFKAKSVILLTDGKPRPVLQALDGMYPGILKTGLITSPTPFLTGRPHTIMHGDSVFSDGTVGIALGEDVGDANVEFGLQPLTNPFLISGAQGNMLLKIDGSNPNPTQTLMAAINARNAGSLANKDEEFFLSLPESGRVVKILSGDPSRGAMSLDMEDPLIKGQTVQFMYRKDARSLPALGVEAGKVAFATSGKTEEVDESEIEGVPRVVDGFWASTEGGFIHSSSKGSSVCTVPGASLSWHL